VASDSRLRFLHSSCGPIDNRIEESESLLGGSVDYDPLVFAVCFGYDDDAIYDFFV